MIARTAFPAPDTSISTESVLGPANRPVLVAAHRGAWRHAPENSLAALDDAIALGADIVELDIRATCDDVLVLLHDPSLDRTTNARGVVKRLDYRQLRNVRLRQGSGGPQQPLTGERLPTLASALEVARHRVLVNIDLKDETLADRVAQAVIAAGMAEQVFLKATIACPQDTVRVRASPFFGRVAFVPMIRALPGRFAEDLRLLAPMGCPMFEVSFEDIADVEAGRHELERQGARLWVNTIECSHSLDFNDTHALHDPDAVWGRLLSAGVGAIQTDAVTELRAYLRLKETSSTGVSRRIE